MRTQDNARFTLHKTQITDWYNADEVDSLLDELIKQLAVIMITLDELENN